MDCLPTFLKTPRPITEHSKLSKHEEIRPSARHVRTHYIRRSQNPLWQQFCNFFHISELFSEFRSVYFIITCSLHNYLTTLFFSCLTHNYLILYEKKYLLLFLPILFSYLLHSFPIITVCCSLFCMSHQQPV